MASFKEYTSRPITRLAYEIQPDDVLWTTGNESEWAVSVDGEVVKFKAYEDPEDGDYVVYLDDTDVYHCRRDVFHERNVVGE